MSRTIAITNERGHIGRRNSKFSISSDKLKDAWWEKKAEELQAAADTSNTKSFHEGLHAVYRPKSMDIIPFHTSDQTTLLTEKNDIFA